jgi:DNA-binding transcriptional regulator YhcF (GntR family)
MHYSTYDWLKEGLKLEISGDSITPIYMRIAMWVEDGIMDGSLKEDERVYSQYQLAEMFNINPATAAKGLNILAEENTVYKKRGLGMFVMPNARTSILKKRRNETFAVMARQLVLEAKRLEIGENELVEVIKQLFESGAGA